MSKTREQTASEPFDPGPGRLTARPGPDAYLFAFSSRQGPWPDIGRRGRFICEAGALEARVTDRRGPRLSISLNSDKSLKTDLSGLFLADPLPPEAPAPGPDESSLPGGTAFLDPHDGWVMRLTEASGQKAPAFDPQMWPTVTLDELPQRLSPGGLTFIWRQRPTPENDPTGVLVSHLEQAGDRMLILGDAPADLESAAGLPGALFLGPAAPGEALCPASVHTKISEAAAAREEAQTELRNQLNELKRGEAAVKAEEARWGDLAALENRFATLGREAEARRRRWEKTRLETKRAGEAWEKAAATLEAAAGGLLGWVRQKRPDEKLIQRVKVRQAALEEAEAAMAETRREEESLLAEALSLEKRLSAMRRDSEAWPSPVTLEERRLAFKKQEESLADRLASVTARPAPTTRSLAGSARRLLALTADSAPGEAMADETFDVIVVHVSRPPDHRGRLALAGLAARARRHLVIMGDFSFWPIWNGRAPTIKAEGGGPAWASLILAEAADERKLFLAQGGPFQADARQPGPAGLPRLERLELGGESGLVQAANLNYIVAPGGLTAAAVDGAGNLPEFAPKNKKNQAAAAAASGLGLRADGEIGPANPVSALMTARAALHFAGRVDADGPAAVVLTASPAQAKLISLMLDDLGAVPGRIFCGEPRDFAHWPPVPLALIDPAFEAPHRNHPWAWPLFGRRNLIGAWRLAEERIWLAGREAWMRGLPENSPLAALWKAAPKAAEASLSPPAGRPPGPNFWEALDKAKKEVWAIAPAFEQYWWRPLEEHFLAAARRRAAVTLICAPPGPGLDRDYAAAAIRTLSGHGCAVHLAEGLPGFMAVIDQSHFTWGHFIEGGRGAYVWGGLKSAVLPGAAAALSEILQIRLIGEKMSRPGGGLKNCRQCGWPLVLINQEHIRGYGDEQPLKLACLGRCGSKRPRRLDEREPFAAPPKCGVDHRTPYQRVSRGKHDFWVCPNHPAGDEPRCPGCRATPGDPS
ncbi:MAG: hypothetical protein LBS31_00650 [Candidatus Adiutrix sp.]|jgi:hypothetical protein|nr:hypothetical protein [Candidatus Adiutrix sp.]